MTQINLLPHASANSKSNFNILAFFILLFALPALALEHEPPRFSKGIHKLGIEGGYYSTETNFTNIGGAFDKLPSGQSFSYLQFSPQYSHVINSRWRIIAGGEFRSGTSIGATETRKNSSLTNINFGLQYGMSVKPLRIVPEFSILIPTKSIDYNSNELILSDGLTEIYGGTWISRRMGKRLQLNSKVGMNFRSGGRALIFSWLLNAKLRLGKFYLFGGVAGHAASSDDKDLLQASTRHDYLKTVNGGSLRFDSVNPEVMNAIGGLEYRWSKSTLIGLTAEIALNGKNMASGFMALGNINWAWKSSPAKKANYQKGEPLFEPDFSDYDESLFEADSDLLVQPPKKTKKGR